MNRSTLTAKFRIVTPMFCAGADQAQAELRIPSIKGALRFWWRALQWDKVGGDIKKLHEQEAALFGSSKGGQSRVLIRIKQGTDRKPMPNGKVLSQKGDRFLEPQRPETNIVGEGARYLGYGVMEAFGNRNKNTQPGQLTRPCYPCPLEDIIVSFNCRDAETAKAIQPAIIAFGLFGGLGSKSRKGYGSVTLTELKIGDQTVELPSPEVFIRQIQNGKSLPAWTAFSEKSQFVLLLGNPNESPLELLNRIGRDLVFFRSWGRNGKVFGGNSERRFQSDHALMDGVINHNGTPSTHPERIAFGLPQNYFFSSTNGKGGVKPGQHERRASPLFLHIHQSSSGNTPLAIISLLPAKFLPDAEQISVEKNRDRKTRVACKPEGELYEPILDWMQSLDTGMRRDGKEANQSFSKVTVIPAFES